MSLIMETRGTAWYISGTMFGLGLRVRFRV
jgi:hypothetical protein